MQTPQWVPLLQVSPSQELPGHKVELFTDASLVGFGAVCNNAWLFGGWSQDFYHPDIQVLECATIAIALAILRDYLTSFDNPVMLRVDNQAVVGSLIKRTSRHPIVRAIVKWIANFFAENRIIWKVLYVRTKANVLADALSRADLTRFTQHAQAISQNVDLFPLTPLIPGKVAELLMVND